jgi:type I restriction enzyme, S subunit
LIVVENGIPVINPQNIVDNSIIPLHKTMISEVTFNKLKKYALIENDIIMARRGEMGRCAIVRKENVNWLCGTGSLVIRGDKNKVNTEYLNRYLSSSNIKEQLERASIGATMNNLNQKVLGNLKLRLPSLIEQEFVIQNMQKLSNETKKLQNNYHKKLNDLEELKKSILHKAFNGEL